MSNLKLSETILIYLRSIVFTFNILILVSCTDNEKLFVPNTDSRTLNEFVSTAAIEKIYLDEIEVFNIEIKSENIIFDTSVDTEAEATIIGNFSHFTSFQGFYYTYDFTSNLIYSIDESGNVIESLFNIGRGPGEYSFVNSIKSNNNYLFVLDTFNARINKYNDKLKYISSMDYITGISLAKIDVNDTRILMSNNKASGFFPSDASKGLVSVINLEDIKDTVGTIMPRIVPIGLQPQVFNQVVFSISTDNYIAAFYAPLPWVFIFDENLKLIKTLILDYTVFDSMNIPVLKFFEPNGNLGYGGASPILNIKLLDNKHLLISIKEELIYVNVGIDTNSKAKKFRILNPEEPDDLFWVGEIEKLKDNSYSAIYWDHLFNFKIPEFIEDFK